MYVLYEQESACMISSVLRLFIRNITQRNIIKIILPIFFLNMIRGSPWARIHNVLRVYFTLIFLFNIHRILIQLLIFNRFSFYFRCLCSGFLLLHIFINYYTLYNTKFEFQHDHPSHNMNQSSLSKSKINFQQQFYTNSIFIQNLRKQSSKIQQMLVFIERLKNDNQIKDKIIYELKRREGEIKLEMLKQEDRLREEYLGKLKIAHLRIQEMQNAKIDFQCEIQTLKSNKYSYTSLDQVKNMHKQEVQRLNLDIAHQKSQCEKYKQKYQSCKQQCIILRTQLYDEKKNTKEMQHLIKQNRVKYGHGNQQQELKYKRLFSQNEKLKKQNAWLSQQNAKLQHFLRNVQDQLSTSMNRYEEEVQIMMRQVAHVQNSQSIWKKKYYELQALVNHVEGLRTNWRITKISSLPYQKEQKMLLPTSQASNNNTIYQQSSQNSMEYIDTKSKTIKI